MYKPTRTDYRQTIEQLQAELAETRKELEIMRAERNWFNHELNTLKQRIESNWSLPV